MTILLITFPALESENFPPNLFPSPQSFNSEAPSITDAVEASLARPLRPPPPIPSSLQRICPDRITTFVLYTRMGKESEEYTNWWLMAGYERMDAQKKKGRINWNGRQSSDVWNNLTKWQTLKTENQRLHASSVRQFWIIFSLEMGHLLWSSMSKGLDARGK